MTTAASISAKLILDSKDYDKGIDQAKSKAGDLKDRLGKVGKTMMGVGAAMTAGLTVPIVAFGVAATGAASDLEESVNAATVVFGEGAETILEFGRNAAETVGLANSEFNQLGAVTGALLTNLGFDQSKAADETVKLATRAADMASIFNTEVGPALQAIQSGLKGEFNPLEQFGVKMNAAMIEAKALSMGLADQEGNINDNAKAQAALALVYEQTNKFAGDFLNTSEGLANSTKIMKAQFEDMRAELGEQLLPIGIKIVEFVSGLIEKFSALSPKTKKIILVVLAVVAAIGPLITIVGGLITAISAIIPVVTAVAGALTFPLIAIIAAVVAIIAVLALAWKNNWGGIREKTQAVMQAIRRLWENTLKPALTAIWEFLKENVFPIFMAIAKFIGTVFIVEFRILAAFFKTFILPVLKNLWRIFNDKILPVLKTVVYWIGQRLKPQFEAIKWAISGVSDFLNSFSSALSNLSLPSWLMPGSKTPLQIGLEGINEELKTLTSSTLPALGGGFGVDLGVGGTDVNLDVSVVIQGNATKEDVADGVDLGISRALRASGISA